MTDIYIATKPLQYMVCDIVRGGREGSIIIVDMFCESRRAYERIKSSGLWVGAYFSRNRFFSFLRAASLRPRRLFVDGDIGTRIFLYLAIVKLFSPSVRIYVYEEGVGTYRNDIYKINAWRRAKARILTSVGVATYFGGSFFCSGVYVFKPNEYVDKVKPKARAEIRGIKEPLLSYCEREMDSLRYIFTGRTRFEFEGNKLCVIYLSDWELRESVREDLLSYGDDCFKIVKPHPHILTYPREWGGADWVADASLPAELLVIEAMAAFEKIVVIHHGSSVASYVAGGNVVYRLVEI